MLSKFVSSSWNGTRPLRHRGPLIALLLLWCPTAGLTTSIDDSLIALTNQDPSVRHAAVRQLGQWYVMDGCNQECPSQEDAHKLTTVLIALLYDSDTAIRVQAVRYLAARPDARVIQPLADLLDDEEAQVRAAATEAFHTTWVGENQQIVTTLEHLLKDPSEEVRMNAVLALAMNGNQRSLAVIRERYTQEQNEAVKTLLADVIDTLQKANRHTE